MHLSIPEAVRRGVPRRTLYHAMDTGELPYILDGARRKIDAAALDTYIERRRRLATLISADEAARRLGMTKRQLRQELAPAASGRYDPADVDAYAADREAERTRRQAEAAARAVATRAAASKLATAAAALPRPSYARRPITLNEAARRLGVSFEVVHAAGLQSFTGEYDADFVEAVAAAVRREVESVQRTHHTAR